jgi:hypothetical protein
MRDMKYNIKRRGKVVIISLIKVHEVVYLLSHHATHSCAATRHMLLLTVIVMIRIECSTLIVMMRRWLKIAIAGCRPVATDWHRVRVSMMVPAGGRTPIGWNTWLVTCVVLWSSLSHKERWMSYLRCIQGRYMLLMILTCITWRSHMASSAHWRAPRSWMLHNILCIFWGCSASSRWCSLCFVLNCCWRNIRLGNNIARNATLSEATSNLMVRSGVRNQLTIFLLHLKSLYLGW